MESESQVPCIPSLAKDQLSLFIDVEVDCWRKSINWWRKMIDEKLINEATWLMIDSWYIKQELIQPIGIVVVVNVLIPGNKVWILSRKPRIISEVWL